MPGADPLAAGRLVLDALGLLATRAPVVLVVEDLHWIDQPSAQALRFALRRLSEERVLAVLTTRPEGPVQLDQGWRRLCDDRGRRLRLGALGPAEVAQLASALGGCTLSGPAARRLCRHAGGNPLYTRWLIEELDPAVLAAVSGPLPAPRSLATLLVARLAACSPGTRDLVSAAAVLGEHCSLAQAVSLAEVPAPAEALAGGLKAGLLVERHDEEGVHQVQFPHPLVRAAIYSDLSPARRAALHLSAARLTAGAADLAHRAAAASGPDAGLAAELAELAAGESATGHHAAAARHLIIAADLSVEGQLREDRLLAACTVWLRAGAVHEVNSRRALIEALPPSPQRDHLRGFLAHLEGRSQDARNALRAALDQLQASGGNDTRAAEAAPRLAGLAVFDWDWQAALALVRSVPDTGSPLSLLVRCIALTMGGRATDARSLLDTRGRTRPGRGDVLESLAAGFVAAWSDDVSGAKRELEAIVGRPDGFGGSVRSAAQWLLADVHYRLGAFDDAAVAAELTRSLLQDTGRAGSPEIAMAHAVGAYAASARGDWADAQACVAAAQARAGPTASLFERAAAAAATWSLAVALDDPAGMLEAACAFDVDADAPELSLFPFGPVMAEALWRVGRTDEADARLAAYEAQARQLRRDSAALAAARVRGLIEADRHDAGAALRAFDEAVTVAERLPRSLEVARFKAAHGVVLGRLGKRTAAADQTAKARNIFARISARPYLDRAELQLERLGRRVSRRSGTCQLTASESVVARLVASGLSNKQVADRLMVSRKAVEFHLANIYAKLGVSSRSQLAARRDFPGP